MKLEPAELALILQGLVDLKPCVPVRLAEGAHGIAVVDVIAFRQKLRDEIERLDRHGMFKGVTG